MATCFLGGGWAPVCQWSEVSEFLVLLSYRVFTLPIKLSWPQHTSFLTSLHFLFFAHFTGDAPLTSAPLKTQDTSSIPFSLSLQTYSCSHFSLAKKQPQDNKMWGRPYHVQHKLGQSNGRKESHTACWKLNRKDMFPQMTWQCHLETIQNIRWTTTTNPLQE